MPTSLGDLSVIDLLRLYSDVLEDLRRRGVTRSTNSPVADYTEQLVAAALGLTRTGNSKSGYDATDAAGVRYQIKGRRLTPHNRSTQLSAIRKLSEKPFDVLIAVVYHPDFTIDYAAQVRYEVVVALSKPDLHTNSSRFLMRRSVLAATGVVDITAELSTFATFRQCLMV